MICANFGAFTTKPSFFHKSAALNGDSRKARLSATAYAYSWLVQTARVLLMVLYTAALYSGHSMLALAVLCAAQ